MKIGLILIGLIFLIASVTAITENTNDYNVVTYLDMNVSSTAVPNDNVKVRVQFLDENSAVITNKQVRLWTTNVYGQLVKDYSEQITEDKILRIYTNGNGYIYYTFLVEEGVYRLDQNYTVHVNLDANTATSDFTVVVGDAGLHSYLGDKARLIEDSIPSIMILLFAIIVILIFIYLISRIF